MLESHLAPGRPRVLPEACAGSPLWQRVDERGGTQEREMKNKGLGQNVGEEQQEK